MLPALLLVVAWAKLLATSNHVIGASMIVIDFF